MLIAEEGTGHTIPVLVTCVDTSPSSSTAWSPGAVATVGVLSAMACAVVFCTLYTLVVPEPSPAPGSGGGSAGPNWGDALARRVSLTTTVPPLLCAGDPSHRRRRTPGTADLSAMDAVRALSSGAVVLVRAEARHGVTGGARRPAATGIPVQFVARTYSPRTTACQGHTVLIIAWTPGVVNVEDLVWSLKSPAGQVRSTMCRAHGRCSLAMGWGSPVRQDVQYL